MIVGTHFYDGASDAAARQAVAMDALRDLPIGAVVDLQWREGPPRRPWIRTVAALRLDSCGVGGVPGRRKPIASEVMDVLARLARDGGHQYFMYINADVIVTQAAVDLVRASELDGFGFSRLDVAEPASPEGDLTLSGLDAFAFDVDWWRRNRRRFRPYILGEACWDNVYAAVLMCHGRGRLASRGEIRHVHHDTAWGRSGFADYNWFLAALDSRYFSLWVDYYDQIVAARGRGSADDEAIAERVFVWRHSPLAALWQAGRSVKARWRFRTQVAEWRRLHAPEDPS